MMNISERWRVVALLVWVAVCAGLVGCESSPRTSDRDLRIVDREELLDLLHDAQQPAVLIDVRSPQRYEVGHISGAINIPLPELVRNDARLAEASRLIVYADGWNDILSAAAAKKLIALGYTGVFDYRAGMRGWTEALDGPDER